MHQNVNNFVSKYLSKGLVENVCVRVCVYICRQQEKKGEWEREEINMANVDDYWI